MTFKYWHHKNKFDAEGELVFSCQAETIQEADQLYLKATGKDISKQMDIGCTVEK